MREAAKANGITGGIMNFPWPTTNTAFGFDLTRMVKVKVLDLDHEFQTMAHELSNTLYWGFNSTILNKGSKRNKSFMLRNIDLYVKPYEQGN